MGILLARGFVSTRPPLLKASYKVVHWIAKEKEPHTINEPLVKPCALEMMVIVLGQDASKTLFIIPLSGVTVQDQIVNMSKDVLDQIVSYLEASSEIFSIQLDECIDCSNFA